jgi:site-specific recombinase XerD
VRDDAPALFVDSSGRRFPYYTFRRQIKSCARKAGISVEVTPHTFRRSCATELLRGGANMYHVKELLGHESLETLKHYAKLTITDLKVTHEKCHPREQEERAGQGD